MALKELDCISEVLYDIIKTELYSFELIKSEGISMILMRNNPRQEYINAHLFTTVTKDSIL